jgi:hypothetical protein
MSHHKTTRLCSTGFASKDADRPSREIDTESVGPSRSDNSSGCFSVNQRFYPYLIGARLWP